MDVEYKINTFLSPERCTSLPKRGREKSREERKGEGQRRDEKIEEKRREKKRSEEKRRGEKRERNSDSKSI